MENEKLIRVIVESLPVVETTWIDAFAALLTPAIALVAIYIAFQQHKINKQRLRYETYERRLAVYKAVQKHLSVILRKGKATYDECSEFYSEASEAAFLFDKSVQEKIDEIYEKSIDLASHVEELYPSDGSPGLPVGEERSRVSAEKCELLKWHTHQLTSTREFFAEKLGLRSA